MGQKHDLPAVLHEWAEVFMKQSFRELLLFAKEHGFSMSQLGALMHINRRGACGVAEIGDDLGVTSAAASQMLDRLVHQGLIVRAEDPVDRRAKRIELTKEGNIVVNQSLEARNRWFDDLDQTLNSAERGRIVDALRLLIEKTRDFEQETV
jgi:DNA-binding MarR family transcriptional regulator